jgi:hypothetical protein
LTLITDTCVWNGNWFCSMHMRFCTCKWQVCIEQVPSW